MSRQSLYHTDLTLPARHRAVVKFDTGINLDLKMPESITNNVELEGNPKWQVLYS